MPNLAAFLAPLVLLLPVPTADNAARPETGPEIAAQDIAGQDIAPQDQISLLAKPPVEQKKPAKVWFTNEGANGFPVQNQVRIEQRVIIRIAPRRPNPGDDLTAPTSLPQRPQKVVERKMGKCLNVGGIVGVQATNGNRLMLFMRDQRIIAADLEKACAARDFYSGFYVERSKDGNLCVERDRLQSRTGVKCKVTGLRQLVRQ